MLGRSKRTIPCKTAERLLTHSVHHHLFLPMFWLLIPKVPIILKAWIEKHRHYHKSHNCIFLANFFVILVIALSTWWLISFCSLYNVAMWTMSKRWSPYLFLIFYICGSYHICLLFCAGSHVTNLFTRFENIILFSVTFDAYIVSRLAMGSSGRYNAIPAGAEDDDSDDDDFWMSSSIRSRPAHPTTNVSAHEDPYSDICTLPNGSQRSGYGGDLQPDLPWVWNLFYFHHICLLHYYKDSMSIHNLPPFSS